MQVLFLEYLVTLLQFPTCRYEHSISQVTISANLQKEEGVYEYVEAAVETLSIG